MTQLRLLFLGPPQIQTDDNVIVITRRKSMAILAYLAVQGEIQRRDTLAALLWPESSQSRARSSLRRELWDLHQTVGTEWLDTTADTIGLVADVWTDAAHFESLLSGLGATPGAEPAVSQIAHCQAAVELYRGDFLTGFTLPDSPDFDDWQYFQVEHYRRLFANALTVLTAAHESRQNYDAAISVTRRRLALDPLYEPAHRQLITFYALTRQTAAALRQYQECQRLLNEEFGVEPETETTALYQSIRTRRFFEQSPPSAASSADATPVALQETEASPATDTIFTQDELRPVTVLCVGLHANDAFDEIHPDAMAEKVNQLRQTAVQALSTYDVPLHSLSLGRVLAIFGSDHIHEDDAERAILAALAIRDADTGLDISIGVNSGVAYIIAAQDREPAIGAVVNQAVHLQAMAEVGEIMIGAGTYQRVRRSFRTTQRTLTLPGSSKPVPVHSVHAQARQPGKSRGIEGLQTMLVGRDEELSQLEEVLKQTSAGQGHIVCLNGEAGLGKSRLVAETKKLAQAHSSTFGWLEGRCQERTTTTAYAPFLDLLNSYFGWGPDADDALRSARLVAELTALEEEGLLPPMAREQLGPALGALLSIRFATAWDEYLQHVSPEQRRRQIFTALASLLTALAHRASTVLVLEDLHWADDLSLDLINRLMDHLAHTPLLLLCVYRPDREHRCWQLPTVAARKCPDRLVTLSLRELTPAEVRRMVASLLAVDALPNSLRTYIEARTHGNPFFVEELIRALMDSGQIQLVEDKRQVQSEVNVDVLSASVPDAIQSVILSRVQRLSDPSRQFLQVAAVMGHFFPKHLLVHILPPGVNVDEIAQGLVGHGLIYQERSLPEVIFAFHHVLVRDAIYATLPRRRQSNLHGEVARTIETLQSIHLDEYVEQLAYHYKRSDDLHKAVEYLLKAGEKTRRSYLGEAAMDYFKQALHILADLPEDVAFQEMRLAALTSLGLTALYATNHFEEAETTLRRAISLAETLNSPPERLIRLYFYLGDLLINWQPRFAEAQGLAHKARSLLGEDEQTFEMALANTQLAFAYGMIGDLDTSANYALRNVPFAQNLTYSAEMRMIYSAIFFAYYRRREPEQTQHWASVLVEQAMHHHDLHSAAEGHHNLARVAAIQGDFRANLMYLRQSLRLADTVGDAKRRNWYQLALAWTHLSLGDLETAQRIAEEALPVAVSVNVEYLPDLYVCLGTILLALGKVEEAQTHFLEAAHQTSPSLAPSADALVPLGHSRLRYGDFTGAVEAFSSAAFDALRFPDIIDYRITRGPKELSMPLSDAVAGLERALMDATQFKALCDELKAKRPLHKGHRFHQWCLESIDGTLEIGTDHLYLSAKDLTEQIGHNQWQWRDPYDDCRFSADDRLIVHAANGRDLWNANWSAPCLLHRTKRNTVIQTRCSAFHDDIPALGGLLLWADRKNFLRLDWGSRGRGEVSLLGCLENKPIITGRGYLPADAIYLRLEWTGTIVHGRCSADGKQWYSVGTSDFTKVESAEVGLYAIGNIDRSLYPGAFSQGSAIGFDGFWQWR